MEDYIINLNAHYLKNIFPINLFLIHLKLETNRKRETKMVRGMISGHNATKEENK